MATFQEWLDEVVCDHKSAEAASINNDGQETQAAYLGASLEVLRAEWQKSEVLDA